MFRYGWAHAGALVLVLSAAVAVSSSTAFAYNPDNKGHHYGWYKPGHQLPPPFRTPAPPPVPTPAPTPGPVTGTSNPPVVSSTGGSHQRGPVSHPAPAAQTVTAVTSGVTLPAQLPIPQQPVAAHPLKLAGTPGLDATPWALIVPLLIALPFLILVVALAIAVLRRRRAEVPKAA